jgi:serine protease Do
VTILRGDKEKTFTIKLGELTDQQARAAGGEESGEGWGVSVADLTPETSRRFQRESGQKGVRVTDVDPGSPADLGGVQPGDVIEEVNRQPIRSVQEEKGVHSEDSAVSRRRLEAENVYGVWRYCAVGRLQE